MDREKKILIPKIVPLGLKQPDAQLEIEFDTLRDAKAEGYFTRLVTIDLRKCAHCPRRFYYRKHSGKIRGKCWYCDQGLGGPNLCSIRCARKCPHAPSSGPLAPPGQ